MAIKTIRDKEEVEQLSDLSVMFQEAYNHTRRYKEQALIARNFYDGNQWSEEELKVFQQRKQPPVVFNRIKPIVNTITALQKGNREDIVYKPYDESDWDYQAAKLFTAIARHDNRVAEYEFYESKAFFDYLVTGRGAIQVAYDEDKQRLMYDYIDFRDLYIDPSSKLDNLSDCDHLHIATYIDELDFKILFGEDTDVVTGDFEVDESELPAYEVGSVNKVRIIQSWVRVPVFNKQKGDIENQYDCFIWVNGKILKHYKNPYAAMGRYPVVIMTLYRDLDNVPYGLVRDLIDPQRVLNHARSKAAYILNSNKFVYREGAFKGDEQELVSRLSQPNSVIPLEQGAQDLADITPKSDINALIALMQQAQEQIPDISGVGQELQAIADKTLSGKAIALRQQSGLTRLTEVFDGLVRFRKEVGRAILGIIRDYYTIERITRIIVSGGDEEAKQVDIASVWKLVKQQNVVDYDIITGTDPIKITQQSEAYQNLLQIFAFNPQAIPVEALIKASNMSNKDEILAIIQQRDQLTQQAQQMQMALEQQKQLIENLQKKLAEKDDTILKLLEKAANQNLVE